MKRIMKSIATILCLGAVVFLAGEWPEETPRKKVVACDAAALAIVFTCGMYLKKTEDRSNG